MKRLLTSAYQVWYMELTRTSWNWMNLEPQTVVKKQPYQNNRMQLNPLAEMWPFSYNRTHIDFSGNNNSSVSGVVIIIWTRWNQCALTDISIRHWIISIWRSVDFLNSFTIWSSALSNREQKMKILEHSIKDLYVQRQHTKQRAFKHCGLGYNYIVENMD